MAEDVTGTADLAAECQFCPFCAGLAVLREARPEAVEHLVKAGAELFLAARALLDGSAEIRRKGKKIITVGPGDFFGEIALLTDRPRNATVTTTSCVRPASTTRLSFDVLSSTMSGHRHC